MVISNQRDGGTGPRATQAGDGTRLRVVSPGEGQTFAEGAARASMLASVLSDDTSDSLKTEPAPKTEAEWKARHGRIAADVLDRLVRIIMRRINDLEEANGLAVEILMEYFAWERHNAEKTGEVPVNPWPVLFTILKRRIVDWARRMKVRRAVPLGDGEWPGLPLAGAPQDHGDIWMREAFKAFPAACQHEPKICPDVLVARQIEDKTLREIGIEFFPGGHTVPLATAATRGFNLVHRAEQCFREFIEKRRTNR